MKRTDRSMACLVVLLAGATGAEAQPAPRTVITLGFDDGRTSQLEALPLLAELGMRASFFVNSGNVGTTGYLDYPDLLRIQQEGHEFGGHSVDHEVLTEISPEDVVHQVCDDRVALEGAGLGPLIAFAYPGGATNPEVEAVLAGCGYRYGWAQGGLDREGCTEDCTYAESFPPLDPLRLRSPRSVNEDWTLEDLQGLVLRAETTGGWLGLSFHHICDDCEYRYRIDGPLLREFLTWLAPRAERGTVVLPLSEAFAPAPDDPEAPPAAEGPPPPGVRPEVEAPTAPPPVVPVSSSPPATGCSAGSARTGAAPLALLAWLLVARRDPCFRGWRS